MKRYVATLLFTAVIGLAAHAREVFPLNEGWRFFFRTENSSDNARHVTLPHSWNTDPEAEGRWIETVGNYLNDIYLPQSWSSRRLFVKFHGVQSVADLFVNGHHVGTHRGGATAFTFEITDYVRFGCDNSLMVVVSNGVRPDVLPVSTDMNLYGGIYREAELIVTDRTAVSPLYFGSEGVLVHPERVDASVAEGNVEVHLTSRGETSCTVRLEIADAEGRRLFSRQQRARIDGKPLFIPFAVERPELWSPESPALYTVTVSIGEERTTDQVTVRTGFRSVAPAPAGGLWLNGTLTALRGVSLGHDNATVGGCLEARDHDDNLARIRDLGANALRSVGMPHGQYLYDRCDEQGMMVWVDLPFQCAPFFGDIAYYATPVFEENGVTQLREIVAQNINHPSVLMWGIFSRLRPRGDDVIPYLERLNDTAHAMDPSRPTVACSDQDGKINFITDLIVWRQSVGWKRGATDDVVVWRDQLRRNWSHLRSAIAYGGSGFIGHRSYTAQADPQANWMPEARQTRFHEEYARHLQSDSLFWGVWIDNMFDYGSSRRPYGVNGSGLVTLDRRNCKDAYYLYRALWNGDRPTLHLVDKRRRLRDVPRQSFRIYSSAGEPLLTVGADTVAMTEYADCQYRSDSVEVSGAVEVKAVAGGLRDSVTILVGNVLKPKRLQGPRRTAGPQTTN